MNSAERIFAALELKEPDMIPTFEWVIDKKIISILCPGYSLEDFILKMGLDAIVVSPNFKYESIYEDTFIDEMGILRKKGHEDYLIPIDYPLKSEEDIKKFEFPDPYATHRFDSLKKAVSRLKGEKAIIIQLRDVFSYPRDLRGYENVLMDLYLNPNLVNELIEKSVDYNLKLAKIAKDIGAEIVGTGDDLADNNGLLMGPQLFEKIFLKHYRKLVKELKEMGYYVVKHTDGDISAILSMLIDSGIDCIDPIDPLGNMDIYKVKKQYGHRVCLKGNISCAGVLVYGTPDEVTNEVKSCIIKAGNSGGYILSSSNSIHSGVIPENYVAMLKALRYFGKYPLDFNLLSKDSNYISN